MDKAVVMKSADNVATCLTNLPAGATEKVTIDEAQTTIQIRNNIPFGHKIALVDIGAGDPIIKYAEVIGVASRSIAKGEHVHVHNVESIRARGDKA
ncbi:MAG: UxaA family hydrolase [Hyphomicrobiaceae bacterium]